MKTPVRHRVSSMLSSSKFVRTVTGDLPAAQLGHTQCHEHIYLRKGPGYAINPALCMDDYHRSLQELLDYRLAGGITLVDAQPDGFGRDLQKLYDLSKDSGVNIVAVTGFHKRCFLEEPALLEESLRALTDRFCREISHAQIKAGAIKTAWDGGLEDKENSKFFQAAAIAAAQTGAPVLIHTEKDTGVFDLMKLFEHYGVAPDRLLFCHLDRTIPDPGLHREVLAAGAYLCYDSVNRLKYVSHEQELSLILRMCAAGFQDRIVLSLDTTAARLRSYGAEDMGLDYLLKDYRPMLEAVIDSETVKKLYCTNAANILAMI